MEDLVAQIHNQYPWASEDTASRLAELARSSNIKSSALAVAIGKVYNNTQGNEIKKSIEEALRDVEDAGDDAEKTVDNIKKNISRATSIMGSPSGLEAISELTYAGTEALHKLVHSAKDAMPGKAADIVGGIATYGTGAALGVAAIGTVFTKLMAEQDKQLKQMIDYGMVVGDIALFTELRDRAANLGMSLGDFTAITDKTKSVMTRVTNNTFEGQMEFANFVANSYSDKTAKRFGYSIQDYANILAQEAAMLYETNQIQDFNAQTQSKIVKTFETVNNLSLFLADNIGIQRSEQLRLRAEANENEEFSHALFQNSEYITQQFGAEAERNIKEANEFLKIVLTAGLGEEFANESQQIFANALSDISFDTSILNNASDDFIKTLQVIDPNAASQFVGLLEDAIQGKVTKQDAILRGREFVRAIKDSDAKLSIDEVGLRATELRAQTALIPESFMEFTEAEFLEQLENGSALADTAGKSIDQLSTIAIAFKEAQNAITPGFETTSALFDVITSAGKKFGDTWIDLFGIENVRTLEERRQRNLEDTVRIQSSGAKSAMYNNFGGSNRSATDDVINVTQHMYALETQIEDIESDITDMQEQISKKEARIDAIKQDLRPGDQAQQVVIARLRSEIDELTNEVAESVVNLDKHNEHLSQLQDQQAATNFRLGDAPTEDSIAPEIKAPSSDNPLNELLDFIGKGEGSYESSNRGTIGNSIVGSTHSTSRDGRMLTEMTFADIFKYQSISDPNNEDRLFAVGKYQIIPSTMQEIFKHSGLKLTDKFTAENQDKLGLLLLQGNNGYSKRPKLSAYLQGEDVPLRDAMISFAREWASLPHPDTGMSVYGSGNRASHSTQDVARVLKQVREANMRAQGEVDYVPPATISEAQLRRQDLEEQIAALREPSTGKIAQSSESLAALRREIELLEKELALVVNSINNELSSENSREVNNG